MEKTVSRGFDPCNEFKKTSEHYANLAMTPGWWAYTQQTVIAMEQDESGMWKGLRAAVGSLIKEKGFKPSRAERGEWWGSDDANH